MHAKKIGTSLFFLLFPFFLLNAQVHISTQSHQSNVNCLVPLEGVENQKDTVFSAGQDGFLIRWTADGMGEHYQISDLEIRFITRSPDGSSVAVYETDGGGLYRVSVWDWKTLSRKYICRFSDPLTSLSYSAKGTYLLCGTTSVSGMIFLNASNGSVVRKINDATGVVTLASTSDTENSLFTYSPSGLITYYNLRNGSKKAQFTTEKNLSQVCLFNNTIYLAGVRDNTLYIILATTGEVIAHFSATTPILLSSVSDSDLYYIVPDNGKSYTLFTVKNGNNRSVLDPVVVKTVTLNKLKGQLTAGAKTSSFLYLGTSDGTIYRMDNTTSDTTDFILPLTDNMYDHINDIASVDDSFYFLTSSAVYKSSYDDGVVDRVSANKGYTNIITYGSSIILWSKNTKKTVLAIDLSTGISTNLFTPDTNIQTLRLFQDSLIDIEGNAIVNKFDIPSKTREQLYQGSGLQDAVLYNNTTLFVAKSSATNPPSALLSVDCTTKETVPLSLHGNVAYALSYDPSVLNPQIYGVVIDADSNGSKQKTMVFSWDPVSKSSRSILEIDDEDSNALTLLQWPVLYTNIGKSQVRSYNMETRQNFLYSRSASMPIKVARNSNRLVTLNRDGSISWYNPDMNNVLADWYLTSDGQWFEF